MKEAVSFAAVILAGGASTRMGSPKALLEVNGRTFANLLISKFATLCDPVVVVAGQDAALLRRHIVGARVVVNPSPELGMLSSLQCGLAEALRADINAVFFTPVDCPVVAVHTIHALAEAFRNGTAPVTVPVYEGRSGHPVLISCEVARDTLALPVTAQARDAVRNRPRMSVDVDDPGIHADIDTPAAYAQLLASAGGPL